MEYDRYLHNRALRQGLIAYLSQCSFDRRLEQLKRVLQERTSYITVVLEDIYQSQNASAVLRTCDCFGIQNVHIIENRNKYSLNPQVTLGSSKWLNIIRYNKGENNTRNAIDGLKAEGYRIVATTPHLNDVSLEDFDVAKGKFALFFGTELSGLTEEVLRGADEYLRIPMYGFTESFNISVSAAIIVYHLSERLRASGINYHLSEDEREMVLLSWLRATTKHWHLVENRFLAEWQKTTP